MDKNTDKIFLIKWVGPFNSDEQLKKWEKNRKKEYNEEFNLYLLQGKLKSKRKYSYYCGQSRRDICDRLKDNGHHINEIENREHFIWIGRFANKIPQKKDINVVEKLLTSELCYISIGEDRMLNQTNKKPPRYDVYVINQWFKYKTGEEWKRIKTDAPANLVPDLIVYNSDRKEFKGTLKIKTIGYYNL